MPGAYIPPQSRRTQAVRPLSGAPAQSRRRLRWLPLLGLVPIALIGVVLASGYFARPQAPTPVASAPTPLATVAQPTSGASTPTAAATAQTTVTAVAAAAPSTAAPSTTAPSTAASSTVASSTATTLAPQSSSPAPQATSAATAPYVGYTVQPGDTLRFIARTYGVSAASIAQASGLQNPDRLRIGQVLTIPNQPGWLYRVQPGDTLDQIAARSGVASQEIASASGLTAASVAPGQVLLIPDASAVAQQSK